MRSAVFGTGTVGRTLAAKLDSLGHSVTVGTRDPAATLARGGDDPYADWQRAHPAVALATFADAAAAADLVVNATNGAAALTALGSADLAGRTVLDVSNPLDFSHGFPPRLDPVNDDSLGEQIQRAHPDARVVKALNTVNCAVMVDPSRVPGRHDLFLAGDDADAKKTVTALLGTFGWPADCIRDLGDISAARALEMYLPLWLRLMGALGTADFNIHVTGV